MQNLHVYKNFDKLPIKKIVRGLSEEIRETPTLQLKSGEIDVEENPS